ncbi:hypothetical protein GQ55_5G381200 [Panicum hallii var. hallii]|uniref:Uncharacterized protein n=1 Tax=Panicum hallii var. hallii TaxID=1504633 RepID=A0A2T7DMT7_9POAL|nr:hypothetical protein GQ55_5G381200 [Panicum hallii var. hallii]
MEELAVKLTGKTKTKGNACCRSAAGFAHPCWSSDALSPSLFLTKIPTTFAPTHRPVSTSTDPLHLPSLFPKPSGLMTRRNTNDLNTESSSRHGHEP